MFPERFLPKKHRFVVRFQSKALAYTHMALLKGARNPGTLETYKHPTPS